MREEMTGQIGEMVGLSIALIDLTEGRFGGASRYL